MRRRRFVHTACAAATLASWGLVPVAHAALGIDDATAGLRVALERGAASAVGLLGRSDGFLGNPKVRIWS